MRYGAPSIERRGRATRRRRRRAHRRRAALPAVRERQHRLRTRGGVLRRGRALERPAARRAAVVLRRARLHRARSRPSRASCPRSSFPITCCSRSTGCRSARSARAISTGAHCFASESCCDAIGPANRYCYRAQCAATARALAKALGLGREHWTLSFQSRLGRTPWIQPYTDEVLPRAPRARRPPARGRVPVVRRGLPRDARGDRHPRARAVARARRRGAGAGPVRERAPGVGRRARRMDPRSAARADALAPRRMTPAATRAPPPRRAGDRLRRPRDRARPSRGR